MFTTCLFSRAKMTAVEEVNASWADALVTMATTETVASSKTATTHSFTST